MATSAGHLKRLAATAIFSLAVAALGLFESTAHGQYYEQRGGVDFEEDAASIDADVEVLTSGPVHEGFAAVVQVTPQPGIIVPVEPPEPVEEIPPEVKPAGDVVWLPGYWAWDDDRDDFIWVSGVWRSPPPAYIWVPGYWEEVEDGFQWISGFWLEETMEEIVYLPVPPASLETGPSSPPPGPNYFWVPGEWVWQANRFVWRAGYWARVEPDWVWIPSHYVWTPAGCIHVNGYWDYAIHERGVLFAPVYFQPAVYRRPVFRWIPRTVIRVGALLVHLFTRPAYGHYYFGDFYDPYYFDRGIYPWYEYRQVRYAYDPLFWYYGAQYRRGYDGWIHLLSRRYRYFSEVADVRPPRTLREQMRIIERVDRAEAQDIVLAQSLSELVREDADRFERLDEDRREQLRDVAREFRRYTQERARLEEQLLRERPAREPEEFTPLRVRAPAPPPAIREERERAERQRDRRGRRPTPPEREPRPEAPDRRVVEAEEPRERDVRERREREPEVAEEARRQRERAERPGRAARPEDLGPPEERRRGRDERVAIPREAREPELRERRARQPEPAEEARRERARAERQRRPERVERPEGVGPPEERRRGHDEREAGLREAREPEMRGRGARQPELAEEARREAERAERRGRAARPEDLGPPEERRRTEPTNGRARVRPEGRRGAAEEADRETEAIERRRRAARAEDLGPPERRGPGGAERRFSAFEREEPARDLPDARGRVNRFPQSSGRAVLPEDEIDVEITEEDVVQPSPRLARPTVRPSAGIPRSRSGYQRRTMQPEPLGRRPTTISPDIERRMRGPAAEATPGIVPEPDAPREVAGGAISREPGRVRRMQRPGADEFVPDRRREAIRQKELREAQRREQDLRALERAQPQRERRPEPEFVPRVPGQSATDEAWQELRRAERRAESELRRSGRGRAPDGRPSTEEARAERERERERQRDLEKEEQQRERDREREREEKD